MEFEVSKDGYRVLKVNSDGKKKHIGSIYNQEREINKFLDKVGEVTFKDTYIIFGLSFGEHIKKILKKIHKENSVLIIEFDTDLIEFCREDKEINEIFNDERIYVASNSNEIQLFMNRNIFEENADKLKVLNYCNYCDIYKEEYIKAVTLIKDILIRIKINRNTIYRHKDKFINNTIYNLKQIIKSITINKLKDFYKNTPAIIVSAGPSLTKNISDLKFLNNKGLILSGTRTANALLDKNIKIDLIGIVDPNDESYDLIKNNIECIKCELLFCEMANYKVIKYHKADKIFYANGSNYILNKVFNEQIKDISGGGSIAHTLTNFAIYMGCNPIIFVGQDLAYTDNKNHSELTMIKSEDENNVSDGSIFVEGINGDKVKTTLNLNDFRVSLENIINRNKHIKFINATEGGALIHGTENIKLKDCLLNLEKTHKKDISEFFHDKNNIKKIEKLIIELKKLITVVNRYITISNDGLENLKIYEINYEKNYQKNITKIIKKLDDIDNEIIINYKKLSFLNLVIDSVTIGVENNNEFIVKESDDKNTRFKKELNRSRKIYSEINKDMIVYKEKVENLIDELEMNLSE